MHMRGVWMLLGVLLLAAVSAAEDEKKPALLAEARGWRGVVELESQLQAGKGDRSEEVQTERAEFFAVTDPRKSAEPEHLLPLLVGRIQGEWAVRLDLREKRSGREVANKGAESGRLNFVFAGTVDARTGAVRLRFGTRGQRFSVKTTLSGMDTDGFATFRSVALRRSLLDGLVEIGALDEGGLRATGEREFEVKRGTFVRKVRIRWSLERLEPEVRGRVVDQHGQPVEGLQVIARTRDTSKEWFESGTLVREAKTGADGKFRVPVEFGTWGVEIPGRVDGGVLTRGWVQPDAAQIRFDNVPDFKVEAIRYVFARLPQRHLLERKFQGDVNRYMAFIERRYSKASLARARVSATN